MTPDPNAIQQAITDAISHLEAHRPDETIGLMMPLRDLEPPVNDVYLLLVAAHRLRSVLRDDAADQQRALELGREGLRRLAGDRAIRILMLEFLMFLRHHEEALGVIDELLAGNPPDPEMGVHRASMLQSMMRYDEAAAALDELSRRFPNHRGIATTRCMLSNYTPDLTREDHAMIHRRFGEILKRLSPLRAGSGAKLRTGAGLHGDRIRVGFVSGDFKRHSVAYFALPLLERLDKTIFDVTCFSVMTIDDPFSARFKAAADAFVDVTPLDAPALAGEIRKRGIDVLVDLSGHTTNTRLAAFHLRPAPVQVTWLGYPATTGLDAFNARFVDSITDPTGAESFATEPLVRLDPCFLCYEPAADAPVPTRHADAGAGVVFGSFNNTRKINARCIAFWGEVLAANPGSRLVLKSEGFSEESLRTKVIGDLVARFGSQGVDESRVSVLGRAWNTESHLATYARIDVALDSLPYNGTTTTCEALWMGVPTVTIAGDRHMARVGASVLSAAGCGTWVGTDQADAVRIATSLANRGPRDAATRLALREQVRASTLCDADAYASRWTSAVLALVDAQRHAV
ncbi:MAG: glycosyltransferase [Planctomycetota bacterium]|nr:glycosyltransferase [Planctomycetota bacterium]